MVCYHVCCFCCMLKLRIPPQCLTTSLEIEINLLGQDFIVSPCTEGGTDGVGIVQCDRELHLVQSKCFIGTSRTCWLKWSLCCHFCFA